MSNGRPVTFILGSGFLFATGSALYLAIAGASATMTFLGYAGGGQIGMLAAACCIAAWR
ncbi:hypothetical protein C8D95_102456 [Silicimonas algicola]|uniref:Uncharacterized protein n=1 Tax=Silicimonas algicola TaxID=1826607 RepID=A0A316GAA4_9RHOB|nr:hypothetical protein C8D95_102456 [Silicimonas algicola]